MHRNHLMHHKVIMSRASELFGAPRPALRLDLEEEEDRIRLWIVQELPFVEGKNLFKYCSKVW